MLKRLTHASAICWMLLVPTVVADTPVNHLDPPQGQFSDEWMIVELGGEKVGYAQGTMSRQDDVITTYVLTVFKIGRAGQAVEISMLQSTRESLDGVPLFFDSVMKMGVVEMRTRGTIEKGQVYLTSSQFGAETDQTTPFPQGAKMSWGLFRAQMEHGFKPGTGYEVDIYEPSMSTDRAIHSKIRIIGPEKIQVLGKLREVVKVATTMVTPAGSIESVAYLDQTGSTLRAEVALAGMNITMTATDKEAALKEFDPPEFFMDTLVKVDRAIDRHAAKSIRYTLRISGKGRKIPDLPTTGMQTPQERSGQSTTLEVHRLDHQALKKVSPSTPPAEMQEYLVSSPTLNIKDQAIISMAAEAAGAELKPYALADKLRIYVSEIIREKNLNVGFATASEVCRRREGDCTEHAVLLAALGRARGLPSQVVVGLAYVPSVGATRNVFGFHMWTQFYIGDQWVDFDAALRESDCSPARIALATSSLKSSGVGDIAFAIMQIITGLKIDIDAIETR